MHKEIFPNQREAEILSVLIGVERYGREIRNKFAEVFKKNIPYGSLYTTLDRMEAKGLVESWYGEVTPERQENRKRYFRVTGQGQKVFNAYIDRAQTMARQLGPMAG